MGWPGIFSEMTYGVSFISWDVASDIPRNNYSHAASYGTSCGTSYGMSRGTDVVWGFVWGVPRNPMGFPAGLPMGCQLGFSPRDPRGHPMNILWDVIYRRHPVEGVAALPMENSKLL